MKDNKYLKVFSEKPRALSFMYYWNDPFLNVEPIIKKNFKKCGVIYITPHTTVQLDEISSIEIVDNNNSILYDKNSLIKNLSDNVMIVNFFI